MMVWLLKKKNYVCYASVDVIASISSKYRVLKIVLFVTQIYDSKRIFSFLVKSSVNTVQYVSFFAGRGQQNDYYAETTRTERGQV